MLTLDLGSLTASKGVNVVGGYKYVDCDDATLVFDSSMVRVVPKKDKVKLPVSSGQVVVWRPAYLEERSSQRKFYLPLPYSHPPFKVICSDGFCVEDPKNYVQVSYFVACNFSEGYKNPLTQLLGHSWAIKRDDGVVEVVNPSSDKVAVLEAEVGQKLVGPIMSVPPRHNLYIMPNTCWLNEDSKEVFCYMGGK